MLVGKLRYGMSQFQRQINKFVDSQGQRSLQNAKQMENDVCAAHDQITEMLDQLVKDASSQLEKSKRK